jgi:hypothetical protein
MRSMNGLVLAGLLLVTSAAPAQPPGGGGRARTDDVDSFVARMMAFDKNKDGKLTRDEITDARLLRLFDRADTKKVGVVTKDDLAALYARESQGGAQFGGGGPGAPGGRGAPPQPGQILPDFLKDQLNLTEAQKKQVADLQKDVDAELAKILSAEQKARLKEMRDRGPGGRGGPGGPPPQR